MGYFWLNKTVRHIICSVRFELRHWRTGYGLEKKSCRVGGHEGSLHGDLLFHSSLVMMHDLINFLAHLLDIETSLLNFLTGQIFVCRLYSHLGTWMRLPCPPISPICTQRGSIDQDVYLTREERGGRLLSVGRIYVASKASLNDGPTVVEQRRR